MRKEIIKLSKQKALFEQIADALVYQLNAGTSPLQRPWQDKSANFILPVNASTGNQYKGMNALWLAMQNRLDPRWMTLKQASIKEMTIETGARSTMINFMKTSEMRPLRGAKGETLRDDDNKVHYETVDLADPVLVNAWLFNGEQINNIPDWGEVAAGLSDLPIKPSAERITELVEVSKAEIKPGAPQPFYDEVNDVIHMPERKSFESEEKYNAALLHELIHWTGHESRMGREIGTPGTEEYAKEELRAGIASLLIGSEFNISHDLGQHSAYVGPWVDLLQKEPFELHRAASDAQRIYDAVIGLETNRELNIAVSPRQQQNLLHQGDLIAYKSSDYKVQGVLKGNTAQMMEMNTGRRFKLGPKDGLYASLVTARNAIDERSTKQEINQTNPNTSVEAAVESSAVEKKQTKNNSEHNRNDTVASVTTEADIQEEAIQTRSRKR